MLRKSLLTTMITLLLSMPAFALDSDTISTPDITDAIERAFLMEPNVLADEIDVQVNNGVATLRGEVSHLLAKDRAVLLAETVKGVRSVVDLLEVKPSNRSDAAVRADIETTLFKDPATDSYEVSAKVDSGSVTLTGTVESWHEKILTETLAKQVKGATDVTNDIEIDYKEKRLDSEIELEIEQAMRFNHLVDDGLIDVNVENGRVELSGTVGSAAEKRQARYDAWTNGVMSVDDSKLEVARWARDEDLRKNKYISKSDTEIREAVEAALLRDPRVLSFDVDTVVNEGVVTLRGVVDNLKAKRAAEQDAKNTVGVVSAWNLIKVRPTEARADEAIADDIREALARNPYIDRFDIEVSVYDGKAYLDGRVDSFYEMRSASDIASRVKGTVDVVNQLDVNISPSIALNPWVDPWLYSYDWYISDGSMTQSDWLIESRIEDEFFWSPYVDADQITVKVEDGVAILSGTVDSFMEKGAARDNAYEAGASRVRNLLIVDSAQ